VRVAALYDIHGNLPALEAVLAQALALRPDLVVVGGDVYSGYGTPDVLDVLLATGLPMRWVMGNGDREDLAGDALSPVHRELVAAFEPTVGVDGVLYCHGTPRSDEEIVTRITPPERLERILRDVDERVVVCGHVHQRYDRTAGRWRVVNPGSVGMPYEGRAGAFWALLDDAEPTLRRTEYEVDPAAEWLAEDPDEVTRYFEERA
jgi:putative phosphoesterase